MLRGLALGCEAHGVECLRVLPEQRMAVGGVLTHRDIGAGRDRVPADLVLALSPPADRVGGGIQAHGLLDCPRRTLQRGHVPPARRPAAEDGVDLVADELLLGGMATEKVERERERGGGGLMSRQQEDQRLIAHLLHVHRLAGVRITGA